MSKLQTSIRKIQETDSMLIKHFAAQCPPLDVHTPYTYWVISRYFGTGGFILELDNQPIGFITTIESSSVILIWQIGILKEYRGKGYSTLLLSKILEYAKQAGKDLEVSIAKDNLNSFMSFKNFCKSNNLMFETVGKISLQDYDDPNFNEEEVIYRIKL